MFHVGDVVRKLRLQKGWSQEDLGKAASISKTTVNDLEQNKRSFRHETIDAIAKALGVTLADLYGRVSNAEVIESEIGESAGYKREDIPVIGEGEASPAPAVYFDDSGQLHHGGERTSRPYDIRDPHAYAVVVKGDSMEPLFQRGMRAIVSPNLPFTSGAAAYVTLTDGARLIKIVRKVQDGYLLESANPAHEARFVPTAQVETIHRIAYVRLLK